MLKWVLRSVLINTVLLFAVNAQAQTNHGISALGLCSIRFDCEGFLESFPANSVIRTGWLDNTFGDDCPCAAKLLSKPQRKIVRVHLLNGPGLRNRRLGDYEVLAGEAVASAEGKILKKDPQLLARYRERLNKLRLLFAGAVNTELLLSACLENNFSKGARQVLHDEALQVFPSVRLVDNPLRDSCISGLICEFHGTPGQKRPPYIVDTDGLDLTEIDLIKLSNEHKSALFVLAWAHGSNGSLGKGPFKDPRVRTDYTVGPQWNPFREWLKAEKF